MKFKIKAEENILDGYKAQVSYNLDISIFKSKEEIGKVYGYVVENNHLGNTFRTSDYDTVLEVLKEIKSIYANEGKNIELNK